MLYMMFRRSKLFEVLSEYHKIPLRNRVILLESKLKFYLSSRQQKALVSLPQEIGIRRIKSSDGEDGFDNNHKIKILKK